MSNINWYEVKTYQGSMEQNLINEAFTSINTMKRELLVNLELERLKKDISVDELMDRLVKELMLLEFKTRSIQDCIRSKYNNKGKGSARRR